MIRTGRPPLKIQTLSQGARNNRLLSDLFPAKMASMSADLMMNPYLRAIALDSFHDELSKIAESHGGRYPVLDMMENPERYEQLLKEAGLWDTLRNYGQNIKGMAHAAKNSLSGGGYARQMKELTGGASSGMTSSAAKGTLLGTAGPMRERAEGMLDMNRLRDSINADVRSSLTPQQLLHPSHAGIAPVHPSQFRARPALPSRPDASAFAPGGSSPLFGAPSRPAPRPAMPPMPVRRSAPAASGSGRDLFAVPAGPSPWAA